MQSFSTSPYAIVESLWRNRLLLKAFVKREVAGRYRGSVLGLFWSFVTPLLMLGVYTFVFSVVFNARWGANSSGSKAEYALILFTGLLVFNLFAECFGRAPSLIIGNANYVKKVVFPLEILPWVVFFAALFHAMVSFAVWLLFYLAFFGLPHLTIILLPIVLAPLVLFTLGISWFLASLGVYLRDVSQFIGVITTVLLFLSPIFFTVSALPVPYQTVLQLNPLTGIIESARSVMIFGNQPNWYIFWVSLLCSALVAWGGFAWFQKTRKGFADVV